MRLILLRTFRFICFALAVLAMVPAGAQNYTCTNYGYNLNGASSITFNVQNTNATDILLTDIQSAIYTGTAGTYTFTLLYNTTPIASSGNVWTQGTIGAGQNGWQSAGSATVTLPAHTSPQTVISGLALNVPAGATYGFSLYCTGTLAYQTLTSGAGLATFSNGGVNILTGDNIGWGGGMAPYTPVNYPRGWCGCIGWVSATACTGTPNTPVASGPAGACPNQAFTLTSTGASVGTGITNQWEVYNAGTGTWDPISGANATSYTVASITTATDYRLVSTCANGGGSSMSNTVTISLNPASACYCTPGTTNPNASDNIMNVTFAGINNSTGAGNANGYNDFTSTVLPAVVMQGNTYQASMMIANGGTEYGGLWIDWDQSGTFDASEFTYMGSGANPTVLSQMILVPLTATPGLTRMRVRSKYGSILTATEPCAAYTYGETEDYMVDVQAAIPCSGQPSVVEISGPSSICANAPFSMSATGFSSGLGITYQWESYNATTGTWDPIAGATNPFLTTTITAPTEFRFVTTCSNGGGQDISNTVTVALSSFYVCYCGPATGVNLNSTTFNYLTSVAIPGTALNNVTTAPGTGSYSLYYPTTTTTTATLTQTVLYTLNVSHAYTYYYSAAWIDYDQNGTFDASEYVALTTANGGNSLNATGTFIVPLTATPGQTGMRVRTWYTTLNSGQACAASSSYETEDYVIMIDPVQPCNGTPSVATASGPASVCANTAFTLNANGQSVGLGISYQWETFNATAGTWDPIAGATDPFYTVAGITAPTDYRFVTTCSNGGGQDISNTVSVGINSFYDCYCVSGATNTGDGEILSVVFGSLNNTSACNVAAPGPGSVANLYSNFTTLPATPVLAGAVVPFAVATNTCNNNYTGVMKIYIDYDHDGTFTGVGEEVYATGTFTYGPGVTQSGSVLIPATATLGLTRMRIIQMETTSVSAVQPCGTYGYGETEDYMLDIVQPQACTGPLAVTTATGPSSICPNITFSLSASGFSAGLGITYQWEVFNSATSTWDPIAGATNPTYVVSGGITTPTDYHYVTTCSNDGSQDISNTVSVAVNTFLDCYCGSNATSTADGEILNVTFGGLNNSSACNVVAPGPGSIANQYSNFTTLAATPVLAGTSVAYSVGTNTCNGNYTGVMKIWIDYDHDGTFNGVGEEVVATGTFTYGPGVTQSGSVLIPSTALLGLTRMRVTLMETGTVSSVVPCGTFGYGETEDYLLDIVQPQPCAGPMASVTASGPASMCPTVNFTVSATGFSTGLGVTYQWESAAAGSGNWAPIANATNPNYIAVGGITSAMDYRFVTTCTNDGSQNTSNTVSVGVNNFSSCYCAPPATTLHSFINDYMTNAQITGTTLNSSNGTNAANGYTLVLPTPASNTADLVQGASYNFVGAAATAPLQAAIWIDWDQSGSFSAAEYIPLTIGGGQVTATIVVPIAATPGQTGMRVRLRGGNFTASDACGTFGSGETEDYTINIIATTACSSTPAAVTASGPSGACSGVNFTLNATGATIASGISYQWESSAAGAGSWAPISGATNVSYTGSITSATDFRFVTTCTTTGQQSTSNAVAISMNSATQCYCIPPASNAATGDQILNVTFAGINNSTGAGNANGYNDYTSTVAAAQVTGGSSYSLSMTINNGGTEYGGVWIDWDQNGVFDASEYTYMGSGANPTVLTQTINVPATAVGGTTRMRVRSKYNGSLAATDACITNFTYGETEDYAVQVTAAVLCSTTPSAGTLNAPSVTMCPNTTMTLTVTGATSAAGIGYQWESSPAGGTAWAPISGATTTSYTISPAITAATDYRFVVTCSAISSSVMTAPVTISPAAATQCYCVPAYTTGCGSQDDINTFILPGENGSGFNDVATGCSVGAYDNRTAQTAVQLAVGGTYSGQINSHYTSTENMKVWIDFGNDGVFDATDAVGYMGTFGTTLAPFSITIPAGAATGSHRMRVRMVYGGSAATIDPCAQATYGETHDYTANIIPACPLVSAVISASTTTICTGSSVTFTATPTNGGPTPSYQWMVNGTNVTGETSSTFTTTSLVDGDVVTAKVGGECIGSAPVVSNAITMTVGSGLVPSVSVSSSASMICYGASATLTATPVNGGSAPTYQWYSNTGAIAGATNSTYTAMNVMSSSQFSVEMTSNNSCVTNPLASSSTVTVGVHPSVGAITPNGPTTICTVGGSVTLTAGAGTSYLWNTTDMTQSVVASAPGTYSVTVTSINGCVEQSSVVVTSKAMPSTAKIKVVGSSTVCQPNEVAFVLDMPLGSTTGFAYQWNMGGTPIFGATDSTYSADATGSYTVTISGGGTCFKNSGAKTATVKTLPTADFTVGGVTEFCAGSTVTFTATPAGTGATYAWLKNGSTNAGSGATKTFNASGEYSLVVTLAGCKDTSDYSEVVTVYPMPPIPKVAAVGSTTVCAPNEVHLKLDPTVSSMGSMFQWNVGGSPIAGANDSTYDADASGSYSLTLTTNHGCTKTSSVKVATIKPLPVADFSAGGPTEFCAGGQVVFTAPSLTGYTYTWLKDGNVNAGSGASKTFKVAGVYTVIATLAGCKDTADYSETIVVNPLPVAAVSTMDPATFCAGSSATLNATPVGAGYTYAWYKTNVLDGSVTTEDYVATAAGTYKVMVTDDNGCVSKISTTSVVVKVNPIPVATITPVGSTTIASNGNVKLKAAPTTSGHTYQWYLDGVAISGATGKEHIATVGGDYTVDVTKLGCTGTSAITTVTQTGVKEEEGTTSNPMGTEEASAIFELSAFPNPVSGILNVNVRGIEEVDATLQVMDMNGKLVAEKNMREASATVDMTGYANGMYLIRYKDNQGRTGTIKITKQ